MNRSRSGLTRSALSLGLLLAACSAGTEDGPAPPRTYAIRGAVSGAVVAGVAVTLDGPEPAAATTDASGRYAFEGLTARGAYTVTPHRSGYSFVPASLTVELADRDVAAATAVASACSAGGWCWEEPWPQGNALEAVWASSGDDAWAVGDDGTILHWDGVTWSNVASDTSGYLLAVRGTSATDVWAVGGTNELGRSAPVLHWDGVSWSSIPGADTSYLASVWGSSPSDVWAIGVGIWHWDGSGWSQVSDAQGFRAVWGASEGDVWAVGERGAISHWDGAAWSSVSSGLSPRYDDYLGGWSTPGLLDVWGASATDVWAVGNAGVVLHWDGSAWSDLTTTTCGAFTDRCCDDTCGSSSGGWRRVWGTSASDVWLLDDGSEPTLHFDGSTWQSVPHPMSSLFGIGGTAAADAWAVGPTGNIVRWDGATWASWRDGPIATGSDWTILDALWASSAEDAWAVGSEGASLAMLRWDGSRWASVATPVSGAYHVYLRGVWGSAADDVWAVGTEDTILHWDGAGWTSVAHPQGDFLAEFEAVWGGGAEDVWAVGSGVILHWDGAAWTLANPDHFVALEGVWGTSATDVWAVGQEILHWDGVGWVTVMTGVHLLEVWGSSATDVWAVGEAGAVLHWDGVAWSTVESGTSSRLYDVWASSATDAWAAGDTLLHWDGSGWSPSDAGTSGGFYAVFGTTAGDVLAAGPQKIMRHRP